MNYYYLISGLPDLSLNQSAPNIDFEEALETIRRNLEPEDEKQFRYLLYPNDNRNLLNIIFYKHKNFPKAPYVVPAILSELSINEYQVKQVGFPDYMSEYLREFQGQFSSMTLMMIENNLWKKFNESIKKQDLFIQKYFEFIRQLKEFVARHNVAQFKYLNDSHLGQLREGKFSPSESLKRISYVDVLEQAIASGNPIKIEQCVDQIKWSYLSEIPGSFEREQVFAYVLKLLIVVRWQQLDPEAGRTYLKEIQEHIKHFDHTPSKP